MFEKRGTGESITIMINEILKTEKIQIFQPIRPKIQ